MRAIPLALALATLLATTALAAPTDALRGDAGPHAYWRWVGPDADTTNASVTGADTLWFEFLANASPNATQARFHVVVSSTTLAFEGADNATRDLVVNVSDANATLAPLRLAFPFTVPAGATTGASYHFRVEAHETYNGTEALAGVSTGVGVVVLTQAPTVIEPTTWVLLGAGVILLAAIATGLTIRRRNVRARMNALHRRRSQALREETATTVAKKPEEVARVQQEIRQAEVVREKRREVQILEAKRQDALKTLDLLQKRHEAGSLTKHQFDQMAAKKRADLERIEAEIAQMEAEDRGGSAA